MGKGATEWEDILIEKGIIQAPPSPPKQPEIVYNLSNKDDDDEFELEADEAFMQSYRQKRLQQLSENTVTEIGRADFVREVTEASRSAYVIVHLYGPGEASELLARECKGMVQQNPSIKFVKIQASRCIENYPEALVPTILVYHQGEVYARLTNCTPPQLRKIVKTILTDYQ